MNRSIKKFIVAPTSDDLRGNTLPTFIDVREAGLFWQETAEKMLSDCVKNCLHEEALTEGVIIYDEKTFYQTYCWPASLGGTKDDILIKPTCYHKVEVYF